MAQSSLSNTVTSLLERIKLQVTVMDNGDTKIRKEMLILARSLYLAIETPMEAILRMEWAEVNFSEEAYVSFYSLVLLMNVISR